MFAKNEEVLQAAMQRVQLKTKDSTIPFVVFASVEPQFVPIVVKRLEELGLTPRKDSLEDPYQVLVLEHTDLLKLKSIGSAAAPLDPNDATDLSTFIFTFRYVKTNLLIDKIWEYGHNYKDPYAYILWNLTNNPTACLRDPKTNELLSYCFAHVDWNLGGLFTKDSERGKGYAKQVVAKCSLEMVLRGFTPYAYVSPSNNASLGVFRALGFTFLPLETIWIIAN